MTQQIHYIISLLGVISLATIHLFLLALFVVAVIYFDGIRKRLLKAIIAIIIAISVITSSLVIGVVWDTRPENDGTETYVTVVHETIEKVPNPSVIER